MFKDLGVKVTYNTKYTPQNQKYKIQCPKYIELGVKIVMKSITAKAESLIQNTIANTWPG